MKVVVDGWNNFCMVFELPEDYPSEFCFGGGHPVTFQLVDWFNPVQDVSMAGVSKEVWEAEVGPIEPLEVDTDELGESLVDFIQGKQYVKPGREYLVKCNFGAAFLFTGPDPGYKWRDPLPRP